MYTFYKICTHMKLKCIFQNYRSIVSALHSNGGKPNTVSILTPSLTHIDTLIRNKPKLVNMLDARQMQFDIDSFIRVWDEMNSLRIQREDLENKRNHGACLCIYA